MRRLNRQAPNVSVKLAYKTINLIQQALDLESHRSETQITRVEMISEESKVRLYRDLQKLFQAYPEEIGVDEPSQPVLIPTLRERILAWLPRFRQI